MTNTLIFAGAGASYAVNKEKLPMTKQFFEKLPIAVTQDKLFTYVVKFLQDSIETQTIDIEQVLWVLGGVRDNLKSFDSSMGDFWVKLFQKGWASNLVPHLNGQDAFAKISQLKQVVDDLENKINAEVYKHYSYRPIKDELTNNWGKLLSEALKRSTRLDIFTTNYDPVIETAAYQFQIQLDRGIASSVWPSIDQKRWTNPPEAAPKPLLTKLHGSVDWVWGTDEDQLEVVRPNHPEFHGNHIQRAIIYPGFKGVPSKEPFVAFHRYLADCLADANHLIFVGFAFRDKYLNDLMRDHVSPEARILIIDPAPPAMLPFKIRPEFVMREQVGFGYEDKHAISEFLEN